MVIAPDNPPWKLAEWDGRILALMLKPVTRVESAQSMRSREHESEKSMLVSTRQMSPTDIQVAIQLDLLAMQGSATLFEDFRVEDLGR
jgi:hypothetical protein